MNKVGLILIFSALIVSLAAYYQLAVVERYDPARFNLEGMALELAPHAEKIEGERHFLRRISDKEVVSTIVLRVSSKNGDEVRAEVYGDKKSNIAVCREYRNGNCYVGLNFSPAKISSGITISFFVKGKSYNRTINFRRSSALALPDIERFFSS